MRQNRKKRLQMCDQQGKRATKKATTVTLNKNNNTSGRGSATKTRKSILSGRHLGHSSINNTLLPGDDLQSCDHCRRMDDDETDSYFNSFLTQKYSRRLPIRIAWSANNTQYNSTTVTFPATAPVIFRDDSDTRKMSGSHAGRGRQSSQSLPLATSRGKPADPIQDGCVNSMLWEVRRDPGVRELCRVECEAHHSEKTLVAAHEAGRQNSRAATGAQIEQRMSGSLKNNAKKMTPILKVEPQPSNKTTSVSEQSNPNVTCKVQIAHEPGSCVDKQSQQGEKSLVTAHEARKQNGGAAMRAQREQPMGGSLKRSLKKVTPCLWWSATSTPVQTLAARSFVSVSKSEVHSSGTKPERTNKTTPVEISAAISPVPFSNSHVSFGTKPDPTTNSTSVDKPSQQNEKNLAAESDASGLADSHSLIGQSSILPEFMHSSNLNSCKVRIAHEPGTSVDKPSQQSHKNLVVARTAGRQNSGAATGSQSKQPAEGSLENSAKKVTPYLWWSAATTPAQPLAARSLVSGSNFGGHPSGTRLEQTNKNTSMDNPSQQIEKVPVTACDTGHFPGSRSPIGQSSILTVFKLSSNPNVSCNVQITHKPEYSVDKLSQQSEKNSVAVHETGGQSSGAAMGAHKEQPTDGSLLSVSNLNNNPTDTKPEQANKTTSVDNPSRQSEKSSVAGLDTGLIGQSSIPTAFMQSSDLNHRCKVRTARQPGYVRKGKGGTCLVSSAQAEKPSEVKGLHRYAAHLN